MAEFPITIRSLSRFCTASEMREVIEGLADGTIDIVIGTHRLAQHDVHSRTWDWSSSTKSSGLAWK